VARTRPAMTDREWPVHCRARSDARLLVDIGQSLGSVRIAGPGGLRLAVYRFRASCWSHE
jgi:hypothetical protein